MANIWPKLKNPPVDVALFQLKYNIGETTLNDFLKVEHDIKKLFPKRADNITANIGLPSSSIPLGISKITGTSNAKLSSYTFYTEDQKRKLTITDNSISLVDENKYTGWDNFESNICEILNILSPVISLHVINRISIRFINQFELPDFNDPEQYFKTMISTNEEGAVPYPVKQYGFKILLNIDTNTYSIVNQNIDNSSDKYIYIFDIDVLNKTNIIYDLDIIRQTLAKLREIKNNIFFGNLTQRIIDLCN